MSVTASGPSSAGDDTARVVKRREEIAMKNVKKRMFKIGGV